MGCGLAVSSTELQHCRATALRRSDTKPAQRSARFRGSEPNSSEPTTPEPHVDQGQEPRALCPPVGVPSVLPLNDMHVRVRCGLKSPLKLQYYRRIMSPGKHSCTTICALTDGRVAVSRSHLAIAFIPSDGDSWGIRSLMSRCPGPHGLAHGVGMLSSCGRGRG